MGNIGKEIDLGIEYFPFLPGLNGLYFSLIFNSFSFQIGDYQIVADKGSSDQV